MLLVVPLLAAALALGSARPSAAAVTRSGDLNRQVKGSVIVPPGGYCYLNGASVTGSVTVRAGAELNAS